MSFEEYKEYISFNTIKKQNEKNKYFIMIYKPNENKKEKQAIIKKIKKEYFFTIDDDKKHEEDAIRMFGKFFVKENKNKCNIIYNNKKYKLKEYFDEIDNNKEINEIKIKLTRINNISNFKKCFMDVIIYHLYQNLKMKTVSNAFLSCMIFFQILILIRNFMKK